MNELRIVDCIQTILLLYGAIEITISWCWCWCFFFCVFEFPYYFLSLSLRIFHSFDLLYSDDIDVDDFWCCFCCFDDVDDDDNTTTTTTITTTVSCELCVKRTSLIKMTMIKIECKHYKLYIYFTAYGKQNKAVSVVLNPIRLFCIKIFLNEPFSFIFIFIVISFVARALFFFK